MTESKSTDKLKLLLDFAEKNISKVEVEKIKTLSLTWITLGDSYLPEVKIEFNK